MIKLYFRIIQGITFLYLSTLGIMWGQTHLYNNTKVDSITFVNTRKALNNLSIDNYQKKVFSYKDKELPYRFLLPQNVDNKKKYPLVITFHNSSRIGHDNENQLEHLARIWLRNDIYSRYNCFVIAPQFGKRSSNYAENNEGTLVSKPSEDVLALPELIKKITAEYPEIDKNRIYLVGYSMGASTAQDLLSITPETFAAIVSIAAVPNFSNLDKIRNKKIWLIHGGEDNENPYAGSEMLYKKLNGNKNLLFTTYTYLNHNNIMIPFLLNDEIPKWLFEKRK
ncbi:phospholipase/carboxylesterase [Elizabethkingia miricola]|uniref:Phospholipase/carboxylesterase n=1 Tax=Elizabethkingia miricola TaxID=172045 RepID=A0ABY3NIV8_ELIMR|nr:PHB depolymerase family esterase [Elizabethkingia miricola]TYO93058.1 phospholipase/carboxylesterase [Elizabethkingia miricola]